LCFFSITGRERTIKSSLTLGKKSDKLVRGKTR
jgi:hypothetical protein